MTTSDEYRLLGFTEADQADAERLTVDPAEVAAVAKKLRDALGKFPAEGDLDLPDTPLVSLAAFLETLPDIRRYHQSLGISDELSWATLADLGRHVDLHRQTHGEFGLETHWWMSIHWVGAIYALGRLQFQLYQVPANAPVPGTEPGEWVLGVHIPETGPLTPAAVDDSFAQAREFFPRYYPDKPVRVFTLGSWLLDPYLLENLPPDSNMTRFGRRFIPYGETTDSQESAIYFTFRSRDLAKLDEFPQDTTLQRLIVDRIRAGGTWQLAWGYLPIDG